MDLIYFLIDFILHIDVHLAELVAEYGVWVYAILFLILFCETVWCNAFYRVIIAVCCRCVGITGNQRSQRPYDVVLMLIAAIVGDAVNYTIGRLFGDKLFSNPDSKIFRRSYLDKTISFMRNMAAKRLFSPVLCRSSERSRRLLREWATCRTVISPLFNVIGALLWVLIFTYAGYFFGTLPFIQSNLKLMIVGINFLFQYCQVFSKFIRHKRAAARAAK